MLVREGEPVRAGQLLARIDTADLEAKLIERQGALESARAQIALAEKTRASNAEAPEREVHLADRVRQLAVGATTSRRAASRASRRRSSSPRTRSRDAVVIAPIAGIVGKRHAQPGEKVAFDAPLVTVVDLAELELQALVPGDRHPGPRGRHDGRARRRRLRRAQVRRAHRAHQPVDRAGHARDPRLRRADATPTRALRSGMFANGRIALGRQRADRGAAAGRGPHRGGPELRLGDRRRQARAPHRHARPARRGERLVEVKTALPQDAAGARDALREPEGGRARRW